MGVKTMGDVLLTKDDKQAAEEYLDIYVSLRTALREGKIETSDVEDYLAYKEKLLSKEAKRIVKELEPDISW